MSDLAMLGVGVILAALGGELFVRGAVGLASWARVPAAIIGTTVAAFATSSPELSVAVQSALGDESSIALGDALGSNVVNVSVVLGITLLARPIAIARRAIRRELSVAALAPLMTLATLIDGRLGRGEAVVLLLTFVVWLVLVGRDASRARIQATEEVIGRPAHGRSVAAGAAGLVLLVLAGHFVVIGAKGLGEMMGLDPFVVGATIVAVGTSTPELATTLIATLRGHSDVGVGAVLGSNVFNNLWIVGIAGLIAPIGTEASEVVLAIVAYLMGLALLIPRSGRALGATRGALLLAIAGCYAIGTVLLGSG